ncbi:variable surface lipoprotein [Mycoplasma bovis]|nr:variable surface lipoprotein [Mycoplasmopsis bovis]MBT1382494.1 variable surface lipoprotein [Mycoplasmopsis bovis]MBT1398208.1 variable surface lipoprotein [Mycoplasmopsis bovis]MBT1403406.1 variable surface lipoprotein [Mycoplasmopsis bovis]
MKKINKIFITLASIVSISSLPIVAAACDVEKTEEGMGENSGTKDQEDQTSPKDQKDQTPQKDHEEQTPPKNQKDQTPQKDQEDQTSPKDQKDQTPQKDHEEQTPPKNQKDQTPQKDQKDQTPPKNQKDQTPQKDQKDQTPPKNQKEQSTKKYRLPELKDFLDKNNNELFEIDEKKDEAKKELDVLVSEGALRISNGRIQHHRKNRKVGSRKNKKSKGGSSSNDVEHLKFSNKFKNSDNVNTHGKKENIGFNFGNRKKGIKISKNGNKIVLEWQLYFDNDGKATLDDNIYKQEIDLK